MRRASWLLLVLAALGACQGDGDDPSRVPPDAAVGAPDARAADAGGGPCIPHDDRPQPPDSCPTGVEYCVVSIRAWNAWCEDGQVLLQEVTPDDFCLCGTETLICQSGHAQDPSVQRTCASGCMDAHVEHLEGDQLDTFSAASFCAAP